MSKNELPMTMDELKRLCFEIGREAADAGLHDLAKKIDRVFVDILRRDVITRIAFLVAEGDATDPLERALKMQALELVQAELERCSKFVDDVMEAIPS